MCRARLWHRPQLRKLADSLKPLPLSKKLPQPLATSLAHKQLRQRLPQVRVVGIPMPRHRPLRVTTAVRIPVTPAGPAHRPGHCRRRIHESSTAVSSGCSFLKPLSPISVGLRSFHHCRFFQLLATCCQTRFRYERSQVTNRFCRRSEQGHHRS